MAEKELDIAIYNECCQALRMYSTHIMNMRTMSIVQGFAILSASGYFITKTQFFFSFCASIFGLLFTTVLYGIQKYYWKHFDSFLKKAKDLESNIKEKCVLPGPLTAYANNRKKDIKSGTGA